MTFTARDAGFAIIEAAQRWADMVETDNNRSWADPQRSAELQSALRSVGWQPGWAYCMAVQKWNWITGYRAVGLDEAIITRLSAHLSLHVLTTYRSCGEYAKSRVPMFGALGLMQLGKTSSGHAWLATFPGRTTCGTFEGNTSAAIRAGTAEEDRNGDRLCAKVRSLSQVPTDGLWLKGILNPLGYDDIHRLSERTAKQPPAGTVHP